MAEDRPVSVRPIATHQLPLSRAAALGSAASAAIAAGIGTWPDASAAGGAAIAIPIVLSAVIGLGLAGAWHVLLGYAAHARDVHERSLAAGFAGALCIVGMGCSGWFLASLIGGESALRAWELDHVARLNHAATVITANGEAESSIPQSVSGAAAALGNTAGDEARLGIVGGRAGKGVVYATLVNAARSFAGKADALQKQARERDDDMSRFREAIGDAEQASAAHDEAEFRQDIARASNELTSAASVRLSVVDLGSGLQTQFAEAPISRAVADVSAVTDAAAKRLRRVEVPAYEPISAREAILRRPQPLAWIAALLIETIPAIFTALLLTIWRDEAPPRSPAAPAVFPEAEPVPRRPSLVAAE